MIEHFVSHGIEQGQKCQLHPSALSIFNATISDYLLISNDGSEFLCQVWPCDQIANNTVHYSGGVHRKSLESKSVPPGIKIVETNECEQLEITVVLTDYKKVKELKEEVESQSGKLDNFCRNLLYKMCVGTNFSVDLKHNALSELYGIHSIIVNSAKDAGQDQQVNCSECKGYIINKGTQICIKRVVSKERLAGKGRQIDIGGFDQEIVELCDLIQICFECSPELKTSFKKLMPKGILLCGPPGTGKTTLVKHIAFVCDAFVVTVNGPEVFGARPGETEENFTQVLDKALTMSEEGPTILFLDEVDSLCKNRQTSEGGSEVNCSQIVASFFDRLVDCENLIVIGATNRIGSVDKALRRPGRFDKEVMVNVPNLFQRLDMLTKISSTYQLAEDVDLNRIAYMTNGFVAADLVAMVREAAMMALLGSQQVRSQLDGKLSMHHFDKAVHKVMPSIKKGTVGLVELSPVYWSQIGGLSHVKQQIQQAVEWPIRFPDAFNRMGLPCPRGILLYGPPGCCKTTLVRAAATATNATFIALNGAQMYSPYIGDSERIITEVFQKARAASPSIVFLDEIDSVAGKRSEGSNNRGAQERILSTLLNEMDGIGTRLDDKLHTTDKALEGETTAAIFTNKHSYQAENKNVLLVAATNRPDLIDDALIRPGRIDRVLYVPPPDKQARLEILKVYTDKMPLHDIDLDFLSEQTELYSGADLQNLCREAALIALTDDIQASTVTMKHFTQALHTVEPSLTESVLTKYAKLLNSSVNKTNS